MVYNIYTDGSWSKEESYKTYGGVVVVDENDNVVSLRRCCTTMESMVSGRNHGGELLAAMLGIQEGIINLKGQAGKLVIYHDYKGVQAFVDEWTPKSTWKLSSKMYHDFVVKYRNTYPDVKIEFVKVAAHTGNKYNELADSVANGCIPIAYADKQLADWEV